MDNKLNFAAMMAWQAFGFQEYSELEQYGNEIYNYFVHNPSKILDLENPLLFGKIFQVCLGFREPDNNIQEIRAENAFLCFSQALKSTNRAVHDEACARIMMLLIRNQNYIRGKVEQACENEDSYNPYDVFGMMHTGLPLDMPTAANTKMLFTAYYLYNSIYDKENIYDEFVNDIEKRLYKDVEEHVLGNCSMLSRPTSQRKCELGNIVYDKICSRLRKDIELCS